MNLEQIKQDAESFFKWYGTTPQSFGKYQFDDLVKFAKHCVEKANGWQPIETAPSGCVSCDWLFPPTAMKHERWILCGESAATASVPGNATHWRYAQPLLPAPEAA